MITELSLRIDWSEMDLFGHVNNVSFFKYVQAARVNYWEKVGLITEFIPKGPGCMLASTACEYKKPLFYPGSITIVTCAEFVKNSSFGLLHLIHNEAGEIAAEAHDVIVLYDFAKNEKVRIPDDIRSRISVQEA